MGLGRIQHLLSEVVVRKTQALSLLHVLVPCNLSVKVANHCLHWRTWFQGSSVDETLVLVGRDHDGSSQLLLVLASRASIPQRSQIVLAFQLRSFPLNSVSDLGGVPDADICLAAEGVLLL